jgi:N-acetylneuraminic acid mutarotase
MFDTAAETFSALPNLPVATSNTQAGLVTLADGTKEVIVVAGDGVVATQIFSLDTQTWRLGPDFPGGELVLGSSVQYGDTFLIVGGFAVAGEWLDTIYVYDAEAESWELTDETLAVPRFYFAALLVPDDYVTCSS